MGTYLKKDEKGKDEYFIKWNEVELGQYIGSGSPSQIIRNFLEHKYEDKFIFVLLKRNTPLACFTLYKRLSNFCSCSERSWKGYFLQTYEAEAQLNNPYVFTGR